jgi:hypothetical protein
MMTEGERTGPGLARGRAEPEAPWERLIQGRLCAHREGADSLTIAGSINT